MFPPSERTRECVWIFSQLRTTRASFSLPSEWAVPCCPIFAQAADAVALAGPDGLSVGKAACLAFPPSPRAALVKWLVSELRKHAPSYSLREDPDAEGGYAVTASSSMQLYAGGYSPLEHPGVTSNALQIFILVGAAGAGGLLQSNLGEASGVTFSRAHHYLLALIVHELVIRRRTTYVHHTVVQTENGEVEHRDPSGITSRLLIPRHAVSTDVCSALNGQEMAEEALVGAGGSEPNQLYVRTVVVFTIARRIVDELKERAMQSAMLADLKHRIVPVGQPRRNKNFTQAVRRLMAARIVFSSTRIASMRWGSGTAFLDAFDSARRPWVALPPEACQIGGQPSD